MLANCYFGYSFVVVITMAQIPGQENKEKTTALKGEQLDLLSRIDLDELMKKDEPPLNFPKTLEEFEYAFNEQGRLRHTTTGEAYVFNAREDLHRWNQKRYEALGEIITRYVYQLLETKCNLTKEIVPVDATEEEPKSFIYLSADAMSNPAKLLVLIQGCGVVRAGQWARRLIINQDLDSGTQIPFITRAQEEGYSVMVLNPNENHLEVERPAKPTPLLSPEASDEPAEKRERKDDRESKKKRDFYEKYRNPQKESETEQIPIRMIQREAQVKNRVCAVAMTDSIHNIWHQDANKSIQEWLQQHCRNWVSSPEPLDTPVEPMLSDCPRVSAGTERHELTSWRSFNSIFQFFGEALQTGEEEETSNAVTTRSSHRTKPDHNHNDL
ncbi:cotranscriptional regulator FAM172A homolog isoform X7 [Salvelinus fontinalis]|uniref:cotranscriptional regulator FAM172A homolog isoform X7 n=1 Tax=Salvelinus fontinalis TaxID=8038 RepID=UPI00248543E6|nr:cotranscriptional regulator FAM172A homolog isoform X7 [Salvelinus fontinalis]